MSSEATAVAEQAAARPENAYTAADAHMDAIASRFSGCRPVHLPREQLETYEGRYEFWDGATETAWVACDPPPNYERRGNRLLTRAAEISHVAGVQVICISAEALVERDRRGRTVLHRVGRALGQRIGGNTSAEPYKLNAEVRHPKGGRHGD